MLRRLVLRLVTCAALLTLTLFATVAVSAPVHAQTDSDRFTPAEVCAQVGDIFPTLDDEERQIEARITELEREFASTRSYAATVQQYINPHVTADDNAYANAMFWLAMLKLQSIKHELATLAMRQDQITFDRDLFTEIATAFECGEEEEEDVPVLTQAQSSCHVTTGTAIPWDRLDEITFIAVEDPNPTQPGQRWIEFRVATTHDAGARNPTIWLDRAIAWSEGKQAEGWTELMRGSQSEFCVAIAANCITPPTGISTNAYEDLCGSSE